MARHQPMAMMATTNRGITAPIRSPRPRASIAVEAMLPSTARKTANGMKRVMAGRDSAVGRPVGDVGRADGAVGMVDGAGEMVGGADTFVIDGR